MISSSNALNQTTRFIPNDTKRQLGGLSFVAAGLTINRNYAYDSVGRAINVDDGLGHSGGVGYLTGSGAERYGSYDDRGRLSDGFTYNNQDQVIKKLEVNRTWTYQYDSLSQLTRAERHASDETSPVTERFQFGYDTIGNRTFETWGLADTRRDYTTNIANQYLGFDQTFQTVFTAPVPLPVTPNYQKTTDDAGHPVLTGATRTRGTVKQLQKPTPQFTYDADGNMLTDGTYTFTWDGENRPLKIEADDGTKTVEFQYDYTGARVTKKVWTMVNDTLTLTGDLSFIYHGTRPVLCINNLDSTTDEFVFIGEKLIAERLGTVWLNPIIGPTRNVESLMEYGTVVPRANYKYSPYGKIIEQSGDLADANPYRFSSEYYDAETGFVSYFYRTYRTDIGRFISRDPIEEQGGLNLYAYVGNSPVDRWDYLGQKSDYNICCRSVKGIQGWLFKHCELAYGSCGNTYTETHPVEIRRKGKMDNGKCCSNVSMQDIKQCAGISMATDNNDPKGVQFPKVGNLHVI